MKRKIALAIFVLCIISIFSLAAFAENLITLSVKDGDVRDVLKMMGEQAGINVVPDPSVRGQVTLTLNEVTTEEALEALLKAYAYNYIKVSEKIYIVSMQVIKEPYLCDIADGKMTLIAQSIDMKRVLTDIAAKGKLNLIYDQSVNGQINANLLEVSIKDGLKSLCNANNLVLLEKDGIYSVTSSMNAQQQGRQLAVSVKDGKVSIDVKNGDLTDLIRSIADQSNISIMVFGGNHQLVDLKVDNVPVEDALRMLLSGTRYSFKKDGDVYLVGDKSINSPSSYILSLNEVIHLKYLQAEKVPAMLPNIFPATNIKVIKEQNALAVTGTREDIDDLKNYLNQIDQKVPQIVVEAIIIQVTRNDNHNPLLRIGAKSRDQKTAGNVLLDTVLGKLTYSSIITLTPEFYVELENMVSKGLVTLKARPKITTLNGYQAKINVGNVQYYKTTTRDNNNGQSQTQYQSINAGISLDVVPWVSSTGEITLDLHPNVSNLGGASTDGPPVITQRQVDTTVRVKNGETIIIGGLIQDVKTNTISKVPFLGDLPIIGALFRRTTYTEDQNELIIYITPHILSEENEIITNEQIQTTITDMEKRYDLNNNPEQVKNPNTDKK